MKNCFADINNCNNFQYFVTEWYTIFFQVDHLSRRIFDNGMHFIHCHASEVVWSRMCSSRQWSTWCHFSLKSGHISVPQRLAGLFAIWDHRVLPATGYKWTHPILTPHRGQYLIYLPWRNGRLSWPRWLVIYRGGLPTTDSHPFKYKPGSAQLITSQMP